MADFPVQKGSSNSTEQKPRSSNLIPKKEKKSPKKVAFAVGENLRKSPFMTGKKKKTNEVKEKKKEENAGSTKKGKKRRKRFGGHSLEKKRQILSNIYVSEGMSKTNRKKKREGRGKEILSASEAEDEDGKVLFMINFKLGLKKILVKFREHSNPIKMSQKIALEENLSDEKREQVYLLILNRVNNFRQLVGPSEKSTKTHPTKTPK